uniref:Uncharacterized protein n=1 Tax=Bionectria ochroleuca TaxID=29856 RepID=A0A8H7NHM3_BIOOC
MQLRCVPYHDPEIIRNAALRFIAQVEAGASFPLLATGTLVFGPEAVIRYETWDAWFEEEAQKMAINLRGPDKWDRITHLLTELTRTLIADPLLWYHINEIPTSTLVLDPRYMQLGSASLFGGRADNARKATLEEVRRAVEGLPIICLGELKEWSVANDHFDYPIIPWARITFASHKRQAQ